MIDEAAIRLRWNAVGSRLDERGRRLFAAAEVPNAGRGGLAIVSKITGLARSTINRGKQDIDAQPLPKGRVRRAGGGRRSVCQNDPGLVPALKRLIEPATLRRSHAAVDLGVEKHGEACCIADALGRVRKPLGHSAFAAGLAGRGTAVDRCCYPALVCR